MTAAAPGRRAGLAHVEGGLAGAGQQNAGHGHFHRAQLGVDLLEETVGAHGNLQLLHQVGDVIGLLAHRQHHQVHRHFQFLAEGQDILHLDQQRRALGVRISADLGLLPGLEAEKHHPVLGRLGVELLLPPAIGADVPVKIKDPGLGVVAPGSGWRRRAWRCSRCGSSTRSGNRRHFPHGCPGSGGCPRSGSWPARRMGRPFSTRVSPALGLGHQADEFRQGDHLGKFLIAVFPPPGLVGPKTRGQHDDPGRPGQTLPACREWPPA